MAKPEGSGAELDDPTAAQPSFPADKAGLYVPQLIVNDGQEDSDPDTVSITVEEPPRPEECNGLDDDKDGEIDEDLGQTTCGVSACQVTVDNCVNGEEQARTPGEPGVEVCNNLDDDCNGESDDDLGQTTCGVGACQVTVDNCVGGESQICTPGDPTAEVCGNAIDEDCDGQVDDADACGGGGLPPDPTTVAPPIDPSIPTTVAASTAFLYTGANPIQTGVAPDTIVPQRAAVVRGKVLDKNNQPFSGVTISILNHSEFGQTLSRADGMFDMAVNGGGLLTINYEKPGFLPAQRQVQTQWQDYATAPDMVMVTLDPQVTSIDLSDTTPFQVAQGSVITDTDGTRQATLLFAQGTQAEMVMPDGSVQPLTTLNVRATEYTTGTNGPQAMPGELPPTSGYTYAVELSADEAIAAGAQEVRFSQPVINYVENFLDFPVGSIVPVGYYDRDKAAWVPSDNGQVIKILSITGSLANMDLDGDGAADDATTLAALGVTDEERQRLASLYPPGQELWRVLITHFTPWDLNWPYGPPLGATGPNQPPPETDKTVDQCGTEAEGSIIECQNQILGERLSVVGTPFTLNYRSDRTPGRGNATLRISLSGASVPDSLARIELRIHVAGRTFTNVFPPAANLVTTFTWDGKDVYGRTLQGSQPLTGSIDYVYPAVYFAPSDLGRAFALFGGGVIFGRARQEITVSQPFAAQIGGWDARGHGLGGWTLSAHHSYDPEERVVYLGNGRRQSAAGNISGIIATVAGAGPSGIIGDGIPATQARLQEVWDVATGLDGSFYIAEASNKIRRVGPDGLITTVAGALGVRGFSGDGGPATLARLCGPRGVAIGSDGSLYIADTCNLRIRRVGPDGIITTVVGNGQLCDGTAPCGDGGPALFAQLKEPQSVAIGSDGSLYTADRGTDRIRQVAPPLPGFVVGDFAIASEDGSALYQFDSFGHRRTLNTLTGAMLYEFSYDTAGRLSTIRDGDGNVTTIERDPGSFRSTHHACA